MTDILFIAARKSQLRFQQALFTKGVILLCRILDY